MKTNISKIAMPVVVIAAALAVSCGTTRQIVPMAVNTVNSVGLDEMNLQRSDYEIINTLTQTAVVYCRMTAKEMTIRDQDGEFHLPFERNKLGQMILKINKVQGFAKLGFLSNDYAVQDDWCSPENIARRLAVYRLINQAQEYGADGVIEPVISTNMDQSGKEIIFKTTVTAKAIKLKVD